MALLDSCAQQTRNTDTVATHLKQLGLAVFVQVSRIHRSRILVAEEEYVADFDAALHLERAFAVWRNIAFNDVTDISNNIRFSQVTAPVHAADVIALFVGADNEVAHVGNGCIGNDGDILRNTDRAEITRFRSEGIFNFLVGCKAESALKRFQLFGFNFIKSVIASEKQKNDFCRQRIAFFVLVINCQNNRFNAGCQRLIQKFNNKLALVAARSRNLFHGLCGFCAFFDQAGSFGQFDIGSVFAVRAENDQIFAGISDHLEFLRARAADGAGVSAHCSINQTQAIKDAAVSFEHLVVALAGVFSRTVKRVSVFHDEVAAAHHAETRTTFVTELCLNLVEVHRELTPGLDFLTSDVGHDFFAGRLKNKVSVVSIFKAKQFRAVLLPAAGFLPKLSRLDDRHQKFDGAGTVHFLSDNTFNLLQRAKAHRHVVIDAGCKLTDHACAKHQLLANDFCICRSFFLC